MTAPVIPDDRLAVLLEADALDALEDRARRRLASEIERERLRPTPPPMTTRKGRA